MALKIKLRAIDYFLILNVLFWASPFILEWLGLEIWQLIQEFLVIWFLVLAAMVGIILGVLKIFLHRHSFIGITMGVIWTSLATFWLIKVLNTEL